MSRPRTITASPGVRRTLPLLLLLSGSCNSAPPKTLSAAHAGLDCASCHRSRNDEPPPERCLGCHKPIAERIENGRGVHAAAENRGIRCNICHTEHADKSISGWMGPEEEFRSDHNRLTGFALTGAHIRAACGDCHKPKDGNPTYLAAKPECVSCHASPHGKMRDSLRDCQQCHTTQRWPEKPAPPRFDHAVMTPFPLVGAHLKASCGACHRHLDLAARAEVRLCGDRSCHGPDDKHHGRLGLNCGGCHDARNGSFSPGKPRRKANP